MKFITVLCGLICFVQCEVLPDYVSKVLCHTSIPDFQKCFKKSLEKALPILVKGIPELNVPPLDPFEIPLITVDRTINEATKIKAIGKNVKIVGAGNGLIENVKVDPVTMVMEVEANFPHMQIMMDYDAAIDFANSYETIGHFKGNFTNIQLFMRMTFKHKIKSGVKYFTLKKLFLKLNVGDAHIKAIAAKPELKYETDLLINVINANSRDVLKIANPVFAEIATEALKPFLNQILDTVPAKELIPE